jgi:fatty-acyl-CoA synthase
MNIGEWIFKRARNNPERPFLKEDDREFDNRQFNERVNQTAHALTALGAVKGERVAVLMVNTCEFLDIFFACSKTGAVMVPLNFRLAPPELLHILQDAAPCLLIYSSEFDEAITAIKAANLNIRHWFRHGGEAHPQDPDFSQYVSTFLLAEPEPMGEVGLSDPLLIMYTSGTTGDPKGALITHGNLLFAAIHSLIGYGVNKTYKSLVTSPLFHMGALGASVVPIVYAGGSLVIKGFYNASDVVSLIEWEKINYMFAVPAMFQLMTRTAEWPAADFAHVHFFISGGAPIPLAVIRKYQEEKGVGFAQGYALTETGRLTSLDLEDAISKAGSVGKEVFHVQLRIVDDQDFDVPAGEAGEIIVRGPNVTPGYWMRPGETNKAIRDGWFHTGDMGKRDQDGFLYVVGRKVEMIISSGENIYPAEIERALEALPPVKEAAAVGMRDSKRGEVVAVFVLLNEGHTLSESDVIHSLQGQIAQYKIPKKVFFVDQFPRNATGKILKRELKKRLE